MRSYRNWRSVVLQKLQGEPRILSLETVGNKHFLKAFENGKWTLENEHLKAFENEHLKAFENGKWTLENEHLKAFENVKWTLESTWKWTLESTWKHLKMNTWKHLKMNTWKHLKMNTWKHLKMSTWKHLKMVNEHLKALGNEHLKAFENEHLKALENEHLKALKMNTWKHLKMNTWKDLKRMLESIWKWTFESTWNGYWKHLKMTWNHAIGKHLETNTTFENCPIKFKHSTDRQQVMGDLIILLQHTDTTLVLLCFQVCLNNAKLTVSINRLPQVFSCSLSRSSHLWNNQVSFSSFSMLFFFAPNYCAGGL